MSDSIHPVISYLFGEVLGHHKPQSILDYLAKSNITIIYDFFLLDDFQLSKYDQALLKVFKAFLYQELKDSDLDPFELDVDSQFWFDLSKDLFKSYRKANLHLHLPSSSPRQDNSSSYDSPTIPTRPNINYDSTTRNVRRTDNRSSTLGGVLNTDHQPYYQKMPEDHRVP